jgi:hypothetical protein
MSGGRAGAAGDRAPVPVVAAAEPASLGNGIAFGLTEHPDQAHSMLATLQGFVREYLADGGPMDMLEQGIGGPRDRHTFSGRTMFPERLPSVALALDITTRLLEEIERFFEAAAVRDGKLPDPAATRRRLEETLARAEEG